MKIRNKVDEGIRSWPRAHPFPPFLEHLSFRLGKQLFFIRVEDEERKVEGPGSFRGLHFVAQKNRGHACLMPMKKVPFGGKWIPKKSGCGWGLVDADTNVLIDPVSFVRYSREHRDDFMGA